MKIVSLPIQDSAVGYYRVIQPDAFSGHKAKSSPFSGTGRWNDYTFPDEVYAKELKDADVMHSTAVLSKERALKYLDIRKHFNLKWIIDMDDNYYSVHYDNPAKNNPKWTTDNMEMCLRMADGVTVSVPALKELYGHLNDNVIVVPNALNLKNWKPQHKKHKGIRIGWEGAMGHKNDLELAIPAIKELQKKYDITFVCLGYKPEGINCEHHKWSSFGRYPEEMRALDLDIAIAPLIDSSYNRCKSNLRLLENGALEYPLVYSPVENYKGFPGLTAKNNFEWYENLEKLIKDADLRKDLGKKARDYVKNNYNAVNIYKEFGNWAEKLPRRTDLEPK